MPFFFPTPGRLAGRPPPLYPATIESVMVLACPQAGPTAAETTSPATKARLASQVPAPRIGLAPSIRFMVQPVLSARPGPSEPPGPPRLHGVVERNDGRRFVHGVARARPTGGAVT